MANLDSLKAEVAATMGASPSVKVLIDGIADQLDAALLADGLGGDSKTAQFVSRLRAEAASFAHLAEIGTKNEIVST